MYAPHLALLLQSLEQQRRAVSDKGEDVAMTAEGTFCSPVAFVASNEGARDCHKTCIRWEVTGQQPQTTYITQAMLKLLLL